MLLIIILYSGLIFACSVATYFQRPWKYNNIALSDLQSTEKCMNLCPVKMWLRIMLDMSTEKSFS